MKKKKQKKLKNSKRVKQTSKPRDFMRAKTKGYEKEGIISGTGKGYAFFIPDDKSGKLFIGEDDLYGAIHGDRVVVSKISNLRGNGEGRVKKILERTKSVFVGVVDGKYCLAKEKGMPSSIAIIKDGSVEFENGDMVVAKMVDDTPQFCRIIERLGKEGITDVDILAIIRSYGLPEKFPSYVLDEAGAIEDRISAHDIIHRENFCDRTVITIDGEHSKDFDDAIEVEKKEDGYTLYVHIADVAHYVTAGSKLDKEAIKRGTSVYFADRVIPMLPEKLSNGICSLNEGEERLTLSVIINLDENGKVLSSKIKEGVIKSKARMTYTKVSAIWDGDSELCKQYSFLVDMLSDARSLARKLKANRLKRGAVEFELTETEFDFDKDKNVVGIHAFKRLESHDMIEEFMLIANECVAKKYLSKSAPFIYRVHEAPPEEKVVALCEFLQSIGLEFTDEPTPSDYAKLLKSTPDELKGVVSMVALRSMSKADYRPECKGHFGLAAEFYCHFTSPIRRYPDLAIHRIIKTALRGESLARYKDWVYGASEKSSQRERLAEEAERKVDDLLKAKYMKDKIGLEYDGIISGLNDRGLFVELENSVEGMVKVESMNGIYIFNDKLLTLSCGGVKYRIGDKVHIRVDSVNGDKIAFVLPDNLKNNEPVFNFIG